MQSIVYLYLTEQACLASGEKVPYHVWTALKDPPWVQPETVISWKYEFYLLNIQHIPDAWATIGYVKVK